MTTTADHAATATDAAMVAACGCGCDHVVFWNRSRTLTLAHMATGGHVTPLDARTAPDPLSWTDARDRGRAWLDLPPIT